MPDRVYTVIGELLRRRRKQIGYSQKSMQDRMTQVGYPIGTSTWQSWEINARAIPVDALFYACVVLRLSPTDLVHAVEERLSASAPTGRVLEPV